MSVSRLGSVRPPIRCNPSATLLIAKPEKRAIKNDDQGWPGAVGGILAWAAGVRGVCGREWVRCKGDRFLLRKDLQGMWASGSAQRHVLIRLF